MSTQAQMVIELSELLAAAKQHPTIKYVLPLIRKSTEVRGFLEATGEDETPRYRLVAQETANFLAEFDSGEE